MFTRKTTSGLLASLNVAQRFANPFNLHRSSSFMYMSETMQYRLRSTYRLCQLDASIMAPVLVCIKTIICVMLEQRRSVCHENDNACWYPIFAYIESIFFGFIYKSIAVQFRGVWA
jgi:hypothetical protein